MRLGLWSALVFTLGCVALLALAYYVLAAALGGKDREVLQARLHEFAAVYDNSGLAGLRRSIDHEEGKEKKYYVRVASPWNDVALVSVPDEWVTFRDIPTGIAGYRRQQSASSASPRTRNAIF